MSKKPTVVQPCPDPILPTTLEDFFDCTALKLEGPNRYGWPWKNWTSRLDARKRLEHFTAHNKGRVVWVPFNGSESNDGPMTLNACSGHALIERYANCWDALLQQAALTHTGPMPSSPAEAARLWFGIKPGDLKTASAETMRTAKETIIAEIFSNGEVGYNADPQECIVDARDFGIGLSAEEMPKTILALNRGYKQKLPYLTGKHGQGASSTYQYSDLTMIVSRKHGSPKVAFTFVQKGWMEGSKTPTYVYLTFDGKIPEIDLPESVFAAGTLVRHIGYAAKLYNPFGERSLPGLLNRSIAQALFPIRVNQYTLRPSAAGGHEVGEGNGSAVRGTVNLLEHAWEKSLTSNETPSILHFNEGSYHLGEMDLGGGTGVVALGSVRIRYWVLNKVGANLERPDRAPFDTIKMLVDPRRPILFTLDGQTHAEEPQHVITGNTAGAGFWSIGRHMVVQIDCDNLSKYARYELFTSTREALKSTAIKEKILSELKHRLKCDDRLRELQIQAASGRKTETAQSDTMIDVVRQYLKKTMNVTLETIMRTVRETYQEPVEHDGPGPDRGGPEMPITAKDPATFIRWCLKANVVRMYPGQKYSWRFETDAPEHFWESDAEKMVQGKIHILAHGVRYTGADRWRGGRVRCYFECPEDACVGSTGLVQATMYWSDTAPPICCSFRILVVAQKGKAKGHPKSSGTGDNGGKIIDFEDRERIIDRPMPLIRPTPVRRSDDLWTNLGWKLSNDVGFSVKRTEQGVQVYYNAEYPPLLEYKRQMDKRGMGDRFIDLYEIKLILHACFAINHTLIDEDDLNEEAKRELRHALCSTAEDLLLAARTELELEQRIDKDFATTAA